MWKYSYKVPENKKIRLIIHTDCKNEADDQYALAHHLMTPRFEVEGIVAGHFCGNPRQYKEYGTARASFDEIEKVLELMGIRGKYAVLLGAEKALEGEERPEDSEGARFIIRQAMKEDDRPLYIACQGAVTDIASALLLEPEIARKIVVIWVGGGAYPEGGFEFNLAMDIHAANVLFSSQAEVWQISMDVYKMFAVSLTDLQLKVKPCGEIGEYLFWELTEVNEMAAKDNRVWPHGEIWGLGDQASIAVLMEELERKSYDLIPAPRVAEDMTYQHGIQNRKIRVYRTADVRLTLEDFFAKLAVNYGRR